MNRENSKLPGKVNRRRRTYLGFLLPLLLTNVALCQSVDWKSANHWQLYSIHSHGALNYSLDSLKKFKNVDLNSDSMQSFLRNAEPLPDENTPLWMGYYLTTCQFGNATIRKVIISSYGGFFYDETSKKYYEIPIDIRTQWLNYISEKYTSISTNPK